MSKSFKEIISGSKPTLVDFFAEWCGPCKTLKPILEDVKTEIGSKASIIKVDVDKNPNAVHKFQIRGVQTMIIFKNGNPVWRQSGVLPKNEIVKILKSFS
jgi:thioredoxin 1